MKIGEAGEAFFVFETDGDVPEDLITSPLLEPTQPGHLKSPPPEDIGSSGAREGESGLADVVVQEPDFLDLDALSTSPPRTVSKSPISSNLSVSSLDISSQPERTSSNSVDTVDSTVPTSVEGEEARLPIAHDNFQVNREDAHSARVEHYKEKSPDPGELGDEASPRPDIEDIFGPHQSKSGGSILVFSHKFTLIKPMGRSKSTELSSRGDFKRS